MVIMEVTTSSMSYKIKELLLRAWRERWTEIDWGRSIKRLLPRGVSGDVYDLADCILRQAITGPVPNSLLMSYLNHCLNAQIISFGSAILAITKIQDPKPQCVNCLLEFILKYKSKTTCYGNEEECIALCRALVSLLYWLYQLISISINELQDSTSHDVMHTKIIQQCSDMLNYLCESSFLKALLYVGKSEEPSLWSQWCKIYSDVNSKLSLLTGKSFESSIQIISGFQSKVEWLNLSMNNDRFMSSAPVVSVAYEQITNDQCYIPYKPIAYRSIQAVVSFSAILDSASPPEVIANHIAMIGRFFNLSLPQLYSETLHASLVGLIDLKNLSEIDSKNLQCHSWIGFFLFKIPKIFALLLKHNVQFRKHGDNTNENNLELGLKILFEQTPVLELFLVKYSEEYFQRLFEGFEKNALLSSQATEDFMDVVNGLNSNLTGNGSDPNSNFSVNQSSVKSPILISRLEQTLIYVFKSLDNGLLDNPESSFDILCRMQITFQIILCAAATTGLLSEFAQKLVELNEANKVSDGENMRTSKLRALLFDLSFLSLCNLVQTYGVEVVTNNPANKNSFFAHWCLVNLLNNKTHLSPDIILNSYGDTAATNKLDPLVAQLMSPSAGTEFKTTLVRWNDMCVASQVAIRDVLTAWNHDIITSDNVKLILERLKGNLCCLGLSAACFLFAQLSVSNNEERAKVVNMLNELKNPSKSSLDSSSGADTVSVNNCNSDNSNAISSVSGDDSFFVSYKERSQLMATIMNWLFKRHLPNVDLRHKSSSLSIQFSPSKPLYVSKKALNDILSDTFKATKSKISVDSIYELDSLMSFGGAHWFTNQVVNMLLTQNEVTQLNETVDFAFGLFHLDLEQCALVLLRDTLPRFLLFKQHEENITEPRITSLLKLAIMTTFAAITQLDSFQNCKLSRRCGHLFNYELKDALTSYDEIGNELLENTPYSYEQQTSSSSLKTPDASMDVDFADQFNTTNGNNQNPSASNSSNSLMANSSDIRKEPLFIEFVHFINLLLEQSFEPEFSPRSLVPVALLEQIIICLREDSHRFLQFIPFHLMEAIIRTMPDMLSMEQLLATLSLDSARGRKTGARLLCQLQLSKRYGLTK